MKAQDYLGQIKWSKLRIDQKQKQIDKLKAAAGESGIDLTAPRVQTSTKSDIADLIAEYEDLQREIATDILNAQKEIDEVVRVIQSVSKPLYADILYKKWVEGMTLEKIAVDLHYNFFYIRNQYMTALKEIEGKIGTL